jgi:hypothetical protein
MVSCLRVQFSLRDLLLYSASFSVLLGVEMLVLREIKDGSANDWQLTLDSLVGCALQSIALVGMLRLQWPWRGGRLLNPGSWILLISGTAVIIGCGAAVALVVCVWNDVLSRESAWTLLIAAAAVPTMLGSLVALRVHYASGAWAFFFGYHALIMAATLAVAVVLHGERLLSVRVYDVLTYAIPSLIVGHLGVLTYALYRDSCAERARDLLYWVGVIYIGAQHSSYLFFAIAQAK